MIVVFSENKLRKAYNSNVPLLQVETSKQTDLELVLKALQEFGLLLETDAKLPSVAGLVAREPLRGSWWAHARSHEIFAVLQQVGDHREVMITRLVSEKVTFVSRSLWPELISIATAREDWQILDQEELTPLPLLH